MSDEVTPDGDAVAAEETAVAESKPDQGLVLNPKTILEAGTHFGHRTSSWNPKMRPYIYGRRNLIHIIDIKETVRGLLRAKRYLQQVTRNNGQALFVGTKRQAATPVREAAEACGMPYVTERWLGGTLTNFQTIRKRLRRLEELERLRDSGELQTYSKKQQSRLMREYRKIHRNLNGIRQMTRPPECLVIIDPKKEHNAVHEANILGIKTVALIDTDSNPDLVSLPIPGNDDSIRSIRLISSYISDAIRLARVEVPQETKPDTSDEPKAIPSIK
ncbi:MAG: 30S ribosomal protein S2 [Planctomycetota bacterium]